MKRVPGSEAVGSDTPSCDKYSSPCAEMSFSANCFLSSSRASDLAFLGAGDGSFSSVGAARFFGVVGFEGAFVSAFGAAVFLGLLGGASCLGRAPVLERVVGMVATTMCGALSTPMARAVVVRC